MQLYDTNNAMDDVHKKNPDDMDVDAVSEEYEEGEVDMGGGYWGHEHDDHRFDHIDLEYVTKGKAKGKVKTGYQKGAGTGDHYQSKGPKGLGKSKGKGAVKGKGKRNMYSG